MVYPGPTRLAIVILLGTSRKPVLCMSIPAGISYRSSPNISHNYHNYRQPCTGRKYRADRITSKSWPSRTAVRAPRRRMTRSSSFRLRQYPSHSFGIRRFPPSAGPCLTYSSIGSYFRYFTLPGGACSLTGSYFRYFTFPSRAHSSTGSYLNTRKILTWNCRLRAV